MAYLTLTDVQARMPQFQLTETSRPSLADAEAILDGATSEFDLAAQNMGYTTPITGVKSLQLVREIVAHLVISNVLYARAAAVGGDAAVKSAERERVLYDNYMKALYDRKHPLKLSDAVLLDGSVEIKGQEYSFGMTDVDETEPRVSIDQEF